MCVCLTCCMPFWAPPSPFLPHQHHAAATFLLTLLVLPSSLVCWLFVLLAALVPFTLPYSPAVGSSTRQHTTRLRQQRYHTQLPYVVATLDSGSLTLPWRASLRLQLLCTVTLYGSQLHVGLLLFCRFFTCPLGCCYLVGLRCYVVIAYAPSCLYFGSRYVVALHGCTCLYLLAGSCYLLVVVVVVTCVARTLPLYDVVAPHLVGRWLVMFLHTLPLHTPFYFGSLVLTGSIAISTLPYHLFTVLLPFILILPLPATRYTAFFATPHFSVCTHVTALATGSCVYFTAFCVRCAVRWVGSHLREVHILPFTHHHTTLHTHTLPPPTLHTPPALPLPYHTPHVRLRYHHAFGSPVRLTVLLRTARTRYVPV